MCLGRGPPETLPNFSPSAGQLMLEETLQSCTNKVGKLLEREVAEERLLNIPLSRERERLCVLPGRRSRIHWIPLRTTCFSGTWREIWHIFHRQRPLCRPSVLVYHVAHAPKCRGLYGHELSSSQGQNRDHFPSCR